MHWSNVLTLLFLIGGIALWLFFGAVFGSHGEQIRNTIRTACAALADALRTAATAIMSWARWCFDRIERFFQWLGGHLPEWEDEEDEAVAPEGAPVALPPVAPPPAAPAAPAPADAATAAPASAAAELNPTIIAFALLTLLAFILVNGYLLFEITPDLFSLSPEDLRRGTGRSIRWFVPLAILAGEIMGGWFVKFEQRRKQAKIEAAIWVPGIIFGFCYLMELFAGIRRALSYLESASPFADEATYITWDSATTAGLWIALAGGIPWVIFLITRYIEPALSRSNVMRQFFQFIGFIGRLLRFAAVITAVVIAGLVVALALGIGGIVTGLIGAVAHVASGIVRFVVFAILFVLVVALIDASGMTVTWLRGWRHGPPATPGAGAAILALAMLFGTGCQRATTDAAQPERKFATVSVSDLKPAPKPEEFDRIATVNLPKYVGEKHKVVRVLEPKLHVCLADGTASVESELRRALLKRCAELVSGLSEAQGPETTALVVPVVDATNMSNLTTVRLDGVLAATRCATNPPIPEFPSRSTIADAKMKSIREAYARAERDCSAAVDLAYTMAKRTREEQRGAFLNRVVRQLGDRVYQRTDIIGALSYVHELVRTERSRLGHGLAVRVTIISDLEDDANGCTLHRGTVTCPPAAMRPVRVLLSDPYTRVELHQVLQATPADRRSTSYAAEKGAVEARQRAWRDFWASIAPDHVESFTFTASVVHRTSAEPTADDSADAAGDEAQCQGELLRQQREAAQSRKLSDADWLAYGRALSMCGPRTKPWNTVGLSNRDQFLNAYIIPFVNGDASRGSLFQTKEPAAHSRIVRDWKIE